MPCDMEGRADSTLGAPRVCAPSIDTDAGERPAGDPPAASADPAAILMRGLRVARILRDLRSAPVSLLPQERDQIARMMHRYQSVKAPELPDWACTLQEHDPAWSTRFAFEATRIRAALGDKVQDVLHVGSSAVPGLRSKPMLDLVVTTTGSTHSRADIEALSTLGYRCYGDSPWDSSAVWYWSPPEPPAVVVVHVCETGNPWPHMAVAFRDYLRAHPEDRLKYQRRKQTLAALPGITLFEYTLGKLAVLSEIMGRAVPGAQRIMPPKP